MPCDVVIAHIYLMTTYVSQTTAVDFQHCFEFCNKTYINYLQDSKIRDIKNIGHLFSKYLTATPGQWRFCVHIKRFTISIYSI